MESVFLVPPYGVQEVVTQNDQVSGSSGVVGAVGFRVFLLGRIRGNGHIIPHLFRNSREHIFLFRKPVPHLQGNGGHGTQRNASGFLGEQLRPPGGAGDNGLVHRNRSVNVVALNGFIGVFGRQVLGSGIGRTKPETGNAGGHIDFVLRSVNNGNGKRGYFRGCKSNRTDCVKGLDRSCSFLLKHVQQGHKFFRGHITCSGY